MREVKRGPGRAVRRSGVRRRAAGKPVGAVEFAAHRGVGVDGGCGRISDRNRTAAPPADGQQRNGQHNQANGGNTDRPAKPPAGNGEHETKSGRIWGQTGDLRTRRTGTPTLINGSNRGSECGIGLV